MLRLRKTCLAMFANALRKKPLRLPLSVHLLLLVLSALAPLLIFGAFMSWREVQLQRSSVAHGMRNTAHALALAVEREIGATKAVLETLAASAYLDTSDLGAFYRLCVKVAERRKGSRILLFNRSGQQLINTAFAFGAPLPNAFRDAAPPKADPRYPELPLGGPDSVKAVIDSGESVVSDLFVALSTKQPSVAIGVPVQRLGQVVYVIELSLDLPALAGLLTEQTVPADWFAAILDRKGIVIWRKLGPGTHAESAIPSRLATESRSFAGWGLSRTSNGEPVYQALTRLNSTGWSLVLGAPRDVIDAPVNSSIRLMSGGAAVLLFLAIGAAFALGRRISGPISSLATSAEAIQRGQRVKIPSSSVREVTELHSAVLAAAEVSRELASERERMVVSERMNRLAEVSVALAESIDFDKTLNRLADLMVPDYADWCLIDLVQEGSSLCWRVAVRTGRKEFEWLAGELSRDYAPDFARPHPMITAIRSGQTEFTQDPGAAWISARARDERHRFLLEQVQATGVIIVPLRMQGRIAGTFTLITSRYSERKYSTADVEFAEEVSRRASIALDNARLFQEVQRELTERTRAEEALRESERRLNYALEATVGGVWDWNIETGKVLYSRKWIESLGYSPEEVPPHVSFWQGIVHPDDWPGLQAAVEAHFNNRTTIYEFENRLRMKSGVYRWNLDRGKVVEWTSEGRPLRMVGTDTDITERKKAEAERIMLLALEREARQEAETLNDVSRSLAGELEIKSVVQIITDAVTKLSGAKFGAFFYNQVNASGEPYQLYALSGTSPQVLERFGILRNKELFAETFRGNGVIRSDDVLEHSSYGQNPPDHGVPSGHLQVRSYMAVPVVSRSGEVLGGLFFGHPERGIFSGRAERITVSIAAQAAIAIDNARLYERAQKEIAERKQVEDDLKRLNEELERRVVERTGELQLANVALLHDIEERKNLEAQLLQAQKMESIGVLAGGIAHDFNNLLNIIQGYAYLLRGRNTEIKEIEQNVSIINETVERGSALVQQLLTLARKSALKLEPTDVNVLIERLITLIKQTFPKTIELRAALETDLPRITADKNQVEQALLNLCVNARDAMPEGGTLILKTQSVDGSTLQHLEKTHRRFICVEVIDTGVGMEESVRARIFEPFFTTKNVDHGTGLGLSVVYGIVTNHDGVIDVQSQPMSGTVFRLYFPIAVSGTAVMEPAVKPGPEVAVVSERAATILLVEDEKNMVQALETILLSHGCVVLKATDGQMAVETYQRHKEKIDVVLLDMGLPKLTGQAVLVRMREENPQVKIVVTSGYLEPELKAGIDRAGIMFLHKPYDVDELIRVLQRLSGRDIPPHS